MGRSEEIDGRQRAQITALACSMPPQGHVHWSLRLLADKVVELGWVQHRSHNHVGKILKNELQPHLKRSWCFAKVDAAFLAKMERLLRLNALLQDDRYLVVFQ